MINPTAWNVERNEMLYKTAGKVQLRRYGAFLEHLAENLPSDHSSLEQLLEGPVRLIYNVDEDISILSLVDIENKTISKVLAAVAGTCREVKLLKAEAGIFHGKLFSHGERISEGNGSNIGQLVSDLQDLSFYANRVTTVTYMIVRQLSGLITGQYEFYLPVLIEHLIDTLILLVTLDEIIDAQPMILELWKEYQMRVHSAIHNPTQFSVAPSRLPALNKLLTDLRNQLLSKNLFNKALEDAMDINKSSIMCDHLVNYLKNIITDIESKLNDPAAFNKNWIRANVGAVATIKLFGSMDKKVIKRLHEINRKHYAVTLAGNVLWIPNKFFGDLLPREAGTSVGTQIGEKLLTARTQKLQATTSQLVYRAIVWCADVYAMSTRTGIFQISDLTKKHTLLCDILTLILQIAEVVSFVTNLHGALSKPMSRSTVRLICRLIETQKILTVLETARKGLIQKDKGYSKERLDSLSLIGLGMRLLNGPGTTDRRLIARCALAIASQSSDCLKDDEVAKLRSFLNSYDTVVDLNHLITEACDFSILLHHRSMIPAYMSTVLEENLNIGHFAYLLNAFDDAILRQASSELVEARTSEQRELLRKRILEPAGREIETKLRLHVHSDLKVDSSNPFKTGVKDNNRVVRCTPLPIAGHLISTKRFIEHYLDEMFYNLTTVALHDWKTYVTMQQLANDTLGLHLVENHLPTQSLEQGLDALEIMRNIHVFVARYSYNLNSQFFIERESSGKHLNTIGIRHAANSIRTHGTGIMSTTVNFVYQFLRVKLHTFSQFLYDDHIKSRLMRDIKSVKAQRECGKTPYTYERAEKFQKGIRKLGMTPDGLSYLDQFRQLISQIGNALGYVRLIRSGGMHACSNAVSFLPDVQTVTAFQEVLKDLEYSDSTKAVARRLEADVANLVRNFTEAVNYFKLLLDVFSSAFRDVKSYHLQQFYAIVPPLTLSFVDNAVDGKDKMYKKNKVGVSFTDDGFAMGVAYIIALLGQSNELDSLQWFKTVDEQFAEEKALAESKEHRNDFKLQQTKALTLKRLADRTQEFQLLYYTLSGARAFFEQPNS
ncbi:WASH complex subunit 4 isoform X2 [Orussus abietinus]|uniref:WASH complex subunit 4 isoform X2 n=1 Tax=Orussus abietinus TaxID=222816 RepID=UPI000625D269|nr:WASH complex subunit 4 isoform X2 [Orussus abietinus]